MRPLEVGHNRPRRAHPVAEVEVLRRRVIEVHGLLDEAQTQDACIEAHRALHVGTDQGDVMEAAEGHHEAREGRAGPRRRAEPASSRERGKCSRYRRAASKRLNSRDSQSGLSRSASGMNRSTKASPSSRPNSTPGYGSVM